jgi:hypothetical protein
MEEIVLDDLVKIRLKELSSTLFTEEYFGFVQDAENYVNTIIDFFTNRFLTICTNKNTIDNIMQFYFSLLIFYF